MTAKSKDRAENLAMDCMDEIEELCGWDERMGWPKGSIKTIEAYGESVRAEERERLAMLAECYQFPQGKVIPVPKSFKFAESKKFHVVDNMTRYGIAAAIRGENV